ncbi:kelch-like protein 1 [Eupeodes corollae]|uniref:kelch-like protein 1 n=1 Tax=Eupeodes corollae TaxID=290404 RepID=UPI0024915A3B|nr:kelch-like protein 1 [Eupeodes corollae]
MTTQNSSSSPNENTVFECDQHAANIYQKLQNLYNQKNLFDIVLIAGVGNGSNSNDSAIKISAHKVVLCALSEYFCEIFNSTQTNELHLKDIEPSILKTILDYMYSGSIQLNLENIETILRAAVFLKIENLIKGCCDFVEKNMNSNNCLHWRRSAKNLSLSELQVKSLNIIYKTLNEVIKNSEFMDLDKDELKDVLFNDNPRGHLEEQVFLGLLTWIEYRMVERENLLLELLSLVRYQFLTPKFIIQNIKSVGKTVEHCELVHGWLQYHLWPESRTSEQQNFQLVSKPMPNKDENNGIAAIHINYSNEAEIYSLNNTVMKRSRPISTKSHWFYSSKIVIDRKLFTVGGTTKSGEVTNGFECLDLQTFEFTVLPPMQIPRNQSQLANLNGYLCAFGGFQDSNCRIFIDSMEIYNFSTRQWSYLQPPYKPEKRNRIVSHNGNLYIFDLHYGCLQCYDVSSKLWTSTKLPIIDNLEDFRGFFVGDVVYCVYNFVKIKCCNLSNGNHTWQEVASIELSPSNIGTFTFFENKILFLQQNYHVLEYNLDSKIISDMGELFSRKTVYLFPYKFEHLSS